MSTSSHREPETLGDALRGIGDDEGRPMARTPEEHLEHVRAGKRRRRVAQLSVAGVAADMPAVDYTGNPFVALDWVRDTTDVHQVGEDVGRRRCRCPRR